ncbi:unnamed protein product [Effrenium voratum]|nr:unnamed protein product [Effrenium voratum]
MTLEYARVFDVARREDVCALVTPAHGYDPSYMVSQGVLNTRCIADWRGDGRCDLSNNHDNENCQYDGGDCCLSTCQTNCANEPDVYDRNSAQCEYFCGEEALYWCLDDEAVLSPVRQWCAFGTIQAQSRCYLSKLEIAGALQQCILDDRVHGNAINAGPQCGNQTLTCTMQDVEAENGCHLTKDDCFTRMCCAEAIENGFIEQNPEVLPSLTALYDLCETRKTDNDEPCFPFMVKCLQETRAAKGGCCSCEPGWGGWRCRWPLCWPKCVHGTCVAPDLCHCEPGWKGAACDHAVCTPECIPGQGTCVLPDTCECFYGWGGASCELPISEPACVNGDAVAPDICRCAEGWGGRLCDYPLCQSWPLPSPECVHGTCMKPFECECEPGWKQYKPINATGFDILPFWSQGEDISQETAGTYVKADSRISFLSFWDRQYNSSNAAQCTVPECSIIVDPRCVECDPPPMQRCLKCEPGFFVDTDIDRCERCSNRFPHCQLCGPEPTGPDGKVVLRCLHCDPLYVLEPMPFGEEPSGRCVSDGPIEFSSPVYHVYKDQGNVTLIVQRSIYALRPEFARPITVVVRTRDGTAHSTSLMYGGELASFEFTLANITFEVDESVHVPGPEAWNYSTALRMRFMDRIELPIKIFDDVSYHPEVRYFDVELVVPPEQLMGHQGPLFPFVSQRQQETDQAWMMPQNVYRAPLLDRQDVLSTTRVYIWDHMEATAAQTYCEGACRDWIARTMVDVRRTLVINARTHAGTAITVPTSIRKEPHFIIKYLPRGEGNEESVGTITTATPSGNAGSYTGLFIPTLPGIYKLQVEQAVPGIFAEYWWHRNIHRNAPQQPDITRIDHVLDFWFPDVATAPAFVRWKFVLHFECIRTARWPYNFGHALGVIASPGSTVRAFFWNDGSVTKQVPEDVVPQKREEMIREDCMQDVPYFICIDLLFHDPVVDPFGFYAFEIEWSTPQAEDNEQNQHASVEIMLYHQNDTDYWGWWPIQQGCLLSSGLNIQGSPFEDFQAISGSARAEYSTVLALPDDTPQMTVIVDTLGEVKIDLKDIMGQPVVGGNMIGSLSARLYTLKGVKERDLPVVWDPTRGFYVSWWKPLPPDPIYQDDVTSGRYYRRLIVLLDGNQVLNSPMPVTILLAVSDPEQSFVMTGLYTPARAGEPVWFQIRSATLAGRVRVTGGDSYQVLFQGPAHDPLSGEDRFDGSVTDNANGTYTVNFEIQRPGYYNMHVYLNSEEIGPSPFLGVLIWDDLSARLTSASGPGISPSNRVPGSPARIIAGINTTFEISAKDSYDVQYFKGGGEFRLAVPVMHQGPAANVTFDSGHTAPMDYLTLTDNDDGSYTVEYQLCRAGLTSMSIEIHTPQGIGSPPMWLPISDSPYLVEVLRGELLAETSRVHPPEHQTRSGVPTSMRVDLRDACGNNADDDAMQSLDFSLERIADDPPEAVPFEAIRSGPGEVVVYFTPGRRGEHRLTVLGNGQPLQSSPMHFTVIPSGWVPASNWVLPAIGAATNSTFELLSSPCHAGEPATIQVTSRDMWGDPLTHENNTFMIYLWREVLGFKPESLQCLPLCERLPAQPIRLVIPDASVRLASVKAEVYEYSLMSNVSGVYHGVVSVLRPGAFHGLWYNNPNHSKRVYTEMLRGPLDFDWGIFGPGGTLPSNKYSLQIIGWLRIPVQDRYLFQLYSDTGGRVFLNGTEISPTGSNGIERGHSTVTMEVDLQQGYIPIEILYDHWMGETTRNLRAFLRLGFGTLSSAVPFHVLQAEDMYYEEVLRQPYNPFLHTVHPAIPVHSLEAVSATSVQGTVGKDVFMRVQSADTYGNLQTRRDPASYLRLRSDPPDVAGMRSNDMLSSQHWRIEPLQSGAWDVALIPEGPAPAVHNLTFDLYSQASEHFGALKPVASQSILLHLSVNEPVAETSSLLCIPPPPWPVGVQVTCAVVPRDVQGNEIRGLRRVALYAQPPEMSEELTTLLHVADELDVARQFRFFPTLAGTWHLRAEVTLPEDITVHLRSWPLQVLPGETTAYRSNVTVPTTIITEVPYNVPILAYDEYQNPSETGNDVFRMKLTGGYHGRLESQLKVEYMGNNTYQVNNMSVPTRDLFQLHADLLVSRHNNSLAQCPELSPVPGGQIYQLTEQRAVGSVATLRCLSGFAAAGGETKLRCEWPPPYAARQVAGYAEWFNLSSMPASGLMCRERPLWCPPAPSVPYGLRLARDWRRQVGSSERAQCLQGHVKLLGDLEIICGSRDGEGRWLALDGSAYIPAACMPLQNHCPQLPDNLAAASAGRDPGSVAVLQCSAGQIPSGGDATLVCGMDGLWHKPLQTMPQPLSEMLQCTTDPNFCSDPAPLLGEGVVAHVSEFHLNATVLVECDVGYEPSVGEATAVCGIDPADDSRGRWASPSNISRRQVPWKPLACRLKQSYCPMFQMSHGMVLSLSKERFLGSVASLGCAEGFQAQSGFSQFTCESSASSGTWQHQGAGLEQRLQCGKVLEYCPSPVPPEGTAFHTSAGLEMDSVLTFSCLLAYEPNVALEYPPELFCRPGPMSGRGRWSSRDGKGINPAEFLSCRKMYNWCPRLALLDGRVSNLQQHRQLGSTAELACGPGLEMKFGDTILGEITLQVNCTIGTTAGGVWMSPDGQDIAGQLMCSPLDWWCPPLTAYTIVNADYLEMDPELRTIAYSSRTRAYRSTASVHCRQDRLMLHSYGDSNVVCGLDAEGKGAWRSLRGMLAVTKHCYFTGSPIFDTTFIENGCFMGDFAGNTENMSIPVWFERTAGILFWHRPSEWIVGSTVLEGQHGGGRWRIQWVAEGVLNARVDAGVGELQMDVTQNFTKGPGDWFHIAYVWDLGVGLAGMGRSYLYVDGMLADPVDVNTEKLTHFIWVDPEDLLDIGGIHSPTSPGEYSNIRVYTRAVPEEEVWVIFSSEDPACGMTDDVCPTPWSYRSYVSLVTNPNDVRYRLFPRRPAAEVSFTCDPGYSAFDGDDHIICTNAGTWLKHGTQDLAKPFRCCRHSEQYCPDIDLTQNPGAVLTATGFNLFTECEEEPTGGPDAGSIVYGGCPELVLAPQVLLDLSDLYNISSVARLSCDAGYDPSRLTMDTVLVCQQGVFDLATYNGEVPGTWTTLDGRVPRPLSCRGLQNFCPDPQAANAELVSLSDGLRTGSSAVLYCTEDAQTLEVTCQREGDRGIWMSQQGPLQQLGFCSAVPVTTTTSLQPGPEENETVEENKTNDTAEENDTMEQNATSDAAYVADDDTSDIVDNGPEVPLVLCPSLDGVPLKNSEIVSFPDQAVPGTMAELRCKGGFVATGGASNLTCSTQGTWDLPLECCEYDPSFCPEVPSWRPAFNEPQADTNLSMMVEDALVPFEPCEGEVRNGSTRSLGAELQLSCPTAHVLVVGSTHIRCVREDGNGTDDQGLWEDVSGGELQSPVCELSDHWCPKPMPAANAFLFNATHGRRLGSFAYFRCLNDLELEPDSGSITLRCGTAPDGQSGLWLDAFGAPAQPLSCRQKATTQTSTTSAIPNRADLISGLPGDQGLKAVRYHAANATLGCGYPFVNVGGDEHVYCVIGAAATADGTAGRWVDADGSNIELPICVFRRDWCPQIELDGLHSEALLSSAYEYTSIATLRCHIGYQRVEGNTTLNCINHESLLYGIWDGEPLRCELSAYFCPAPEASNAKLIEISTQFRRGDVVNLECHTGFTYLEGDLQVHCDVSDETDGGQWKVADGTAAKPVVCVPQQDFCSMPAVNNGFVYSITKQGKMGSVVELHCKDGFQDPRLAAEQRTALCAGGDFRVGMSKVSRDLIRATNLVQDVVEELEANLALDTRESDYNWRALMQFEYRWRSELSAGLQGLPSDTAVREVLSQFPNYDGVSDRWLAVFTVDDVRQLVRMLEDKQTEMLDLEDQQLGDQSSDEPLLHCNRTPGWCPLPPLPPHSQFRDPSIAPVALGEEIELECHPHYVYDLGLQRLMCGNSARGGYQWRAPDGGQAKPDIACTLNRSWCPEPVLPSRLEVLEPKHHAIHTQLRLGCPRGYRPIGGHGFGRCGANGWCSAEGPTEPCTEPPDWLRCELIPGYCPPWPGNEHGSPYNSSSAPEVIPVIDPLAHVFLRQVRQLPLPSGALGDFVTLSCPQYFSRASGDTRFKCGHGLHGRGQWQRDLLPVPEYADNSTLDAVIQLVDEATAEPLVCELETKKGVRRKYYDRLPGLFRNHSLSGYDVVPYINQFESAYDAAQFESNLRPELAGNYTLSVEVLGAFVLSWQGQLLLTGRSQGLFPETFNTSSLQLDSETFYSFNLEYWADPLLPDRTNQEMLTFPRLLRLLWNGPAGDMQPVPYTQLYHSFDKLYGYPITHNGINDPQPCDSSTTVSMTGLLVGNNGTIVDGSWGYNYNEDLNCNWLLEATANVRFTIFANFFDVVGTEGCAGDRLEFYVGRGNTLRLLGSVCGSYESGTALVHTSTRQLVIRFVTDYALEREGFNISWIVTQTDDIIAPNPIVSGVIN